MSDLGLPWLCCTDPSLCTAACGARLSPTSLMDTIHLQKGLSAGGHQHTNTDLLFPAHKPKYLMKQGIYQNHNWILRGTYCYQIRHSQYWSSARVCMA